MDLGRGSLIDLRLDGETRRHARHRFLVTACGLLQVSMRVLRGLRDRRNGHSDEIRRRRHAANTSHIVLLLLSTTILMLLRLRLLLLMTLMKTKTLRQIIRTEAVRIATHEIVAVVIIIVVVIVVVVVIIIVVAT